MKTPRLVMTLVVCALLGIGVFACNTVKSREIDMGRQQAREHNRPHTITARAETGGSIVPSGGTSVSGGSSQTYVATADWGYRVSDLLVDGRSMGAVADLYHDDSSSYTFTNVGANHKISALFDVDESL